MPKNYLHIATCLHYENQLVNATKESIGYLLRASLANLKYSRLAKRRYLNVTEGGTYSASKGYVIYERRWCILETMKTSPENCYRLELSIAWFKVSEVCRAQDH
jgi:hypothetical protein